MILRKIKFKSILALPLLLLFTACGDDDSPTPVPTPTPSLTIKESGFVVEGAIGGIESETRVAKYIEELPIGGVLDLSDDSQGFETFIIRSIHDNAIFTPRINGDDGFSKIVVNEEGELIEVGTITVSGADGKIKVKDSERGVYYDGSEALSVFNPTTFENTGSIDMSDAFVPEDINYRYIQFGFRGDIVYGAIVPNDGATAGFTSLIVHQADLSTNTFVGDTQRNSDEDNPSIISPLFVENVETPVTDDLYIADSGNLTLSGAASRVNKIPVGSNEIDPDYVFEPSKILNPSPLNLLPSIANFYNLGNGKAIAIVNRDLPDEVLATLTAANFNIANLSLDDITRLRLLLFTEATAVWCLLDLETKSVTAIEGVPNVGQESGAQTFEYDGDVYFFVDNSTDSAYYKFDPTTGSASKAFDVIGAEKISVFNLADNY